MDDKALKRLSRADLLELMVSVSKENEALQIENDQLKQALVQRRIAIEKAGSIAKASVEINGVLESAQRAADQYLYNIHAMVDDIKEKARQEVINAHREADEIRNKARQEAALMMRQAASGGGVMPAAQPAQQRAVPPGQPQAMPQGAVPQGRTPAGGAVPPAAIKQ